MKNINFFFSMKQIINMIFCILVRQYKVFISWTAEINLLVGLIFSNISFIQNNFIFRKIKVILSYFNLKLCIVSIEFLLFSYFLSILGCVKIFELWIICIDNFNNFPVFINNFPGFFYCKAQSPLTLSY